MRIKYIASVVAALSLAFIPTAAQAIATTLDVQNGGSTAVDLVNGDSLDVTVAGPIAKTGPAVHELYSTWSAQSLNLDALSSGDITWPEGWDLEYTEDGTTWVNWATTMPTDIGAIIAIRALGDVNTVGENTFKTTSTGSVDAVTFAGSGGGDGYNVAVGDNKVFNMYHHQDGTATVECHTFAGELCSTPTVAVDGYSTNHASSVYSDDASGKVYAFVMRDSDLHFGVLCFNFSVEPAVECGFTELETVGADSGRDPGDYKQDLGSSSQDGDLIWSITGNGGELLCFNIATGTACTGDNGWNTGYSDWAFSTGRVTAVDGLVYWTLNDKMGCYNPSTNGLCNGTAAITLTDSSNRMPPLPVEDTSGVFLGACDVYSQQCIDDAGGASLTFPSALASYFATNTINWDTARQNAEQFAYDGANNRFYFESTFDMNDWGSNNITCYDFTTETACAGFDGYIDEVVNFYTATVDSQIPNCVWINGNEGKIYPMDATTGLVGCDLGDPTVSLPYDAVTPRMSCNDDGRVTQWANITVAPLDGVAMADVRVSFYDSEGVLIDAWSDMTPNASGSIDLTGLDVSTTGTTPTIKITAGDISDALAEQISATVTFVAEDPELCFTLAAADNCTTTITNSPAPGDIADGIVTGTSITRPNAGNDVGSAQTTTLPGQNAANMCASSALKIDLPIAALASTGVDAGSIAMGGFAVLAAGGAAVAVTRRRKA